MQLTDDFCAFLIVSLALAAVLWHTRRHAVWGKSKGYLLTGLCVLISNACMAMAMLLTDMTAKSIFHELKFIGVAFMPIASIFFYMDVFGVKVAKARQLACWLCIIPCLTVILALTNPLHHLFRIAIEPMLIDGKIYIDTKLGPYFFVHMIYSYLAILSALVFALIHYLNTPRVYRGQRSIIVASILLIIPVNIASLAGIIDDHGDIGVLAFGTTYLLQSWALLLYKPRRMLRQERELVYNTMEDSVLFFGPQNQLLDLNASAISQFRLNLNTEQPLSFADFAENILHTPAEQVQKIGRFTLQPPLSGIFTLSMKEISDANGRFCGHVLIFHDITHMKKGIDELAYACDHDPLTKLLNRQAFRLRLPDFEASIPPPISVISCSINNMKFTNNVFSFAYGDKVIIGVSKMLQREANNGMCVRLGGDEFLLFVPGGKKEAERIIQTCRENEAHYSLSFGYAVKDNAAQNLELLIPVAIEEMYRDKLLSPKQSLLEIIETAVEQAGFTEMHRRVGQLCQKTAQAFGLPDKELQLLEQLSQTFTIGIISEGYDSSKTLTSGEGGKYRPGKGRKIARLVAELMPLADMIYAQHAHYDGSGFPPGLYEEEIPLPTRILQACVAYDEGLQKGEETQAELRQRMLEQSGSIFDPQVVQALLSVTEE